MCGLFGFTRFGEEKIKDLSDLTNALAAQSAIRGTDATGIAFCKENNVNILKESKSAYRLNLKHSDEIRALTGHTRHSTQGSEKKNYNNHPFSGKCRNGRFALAHNGVLINDAELMKTFKLPKTKIETDSYIAVQLLEYKKDLNFDSIKFMAEQIEGSFSFSILDDKNNIYLVKGDSPIHILFFPKKKIYVYASTAEILWKSLIDSTLFSEIQNGDFEEVKINEGDILKICADGKLVYSKFDYSDHIYGGYRGSLSWWNYGTVSYGRSNSEHLKNDYIEDLKSVAAFEGYSPEVIDDLLGSGFSPEEIEDYIYCMDGEV